jgi:hypothetical protein
MDGEAWDWEGCWGCWEGSQGLWGSGAQGLKLQVATDQVGVVTDLGFLASICAQVEVDIEGLSWLQLDTRHGEM